MVHYATDVLAPTFDLGGDWPELLETPSRDAPPALLLPPPPGPPVAPSEPPLLPEAPPELFPSTGFSGGVCPRAPTTLPSPVRVSLRMDGGVKMTEWSSVPIRLLLGVSKGKGGHN